MRSSSTTCLGPCCHNMCISQLYLRDDSTCPFPPVLQTPVSWPGLHMQYPLSAFRAEHSWSVTVRWHCQEDILVSAVLQNQGLPDFLTTVLHAPLVHQLVTPLFISRCTAAAIFAKPLINFCYYEASPRNCRSTVAQASVSHFFTGQVLLITPCLNCTVKLNIYY
ncbi:hypothetical protein T4D_16990 [Trichinella pseudospiralis]|uniref:Uncharacterized protein n=1 Tax=Trichinella pseudospiralis TaxID=6337 RepID=A0A0V1FMX0_TRIPS|nr:hypothetical protein T4D_16990 [Trichinella pseudospiralis]